MTTPTWRRSAELAARAGRPALVLSALLLLSAPAAAQEKASFRERYDQAAALYKANQYAEAVTAFQALYDEKQVPILLFNIAQAHRRAGLLEDAVPFYERFLKENPKPELQKEAEGYLKEIRDMLAQRERDQQQLIAERRAREEAERRAFALTAGPKEPPPVGFGRDGGLARSTNVYAIVKWTALGVGIAAAGAGAAMIALDGRGTCDLMMGQTLCPQQLATLPIGAALAAVGVAALGTSAAFFVLDHRRSRRTAVSLIPSAGGAALTLAGSF